MVDLAKDIILFSLSELETKFFSDELDKKSLISEEDGQCSKTICFSEVNLILSTNSSKL